MGDLLVDYWGENKIYIILFNSHFFKKISNSKIFFSKKILNYFVSISFFQLNLIL